MARPRRIDMVLVVQAQALAAQAKTAEELRCAQAVLLPALLDATLKDTAGVLGVSPASVARLQARLRQRLAGVAPAQWGGRRRAVMSPEEERAFLAPFAEQAAQGTLLVASPVREALARKLGRPVAASVVYRMLVRQGWRKLAPDTRHPKSDPAAQEAWKKNSPRRWQPC